MLKRSETTLTEIFKGVETAATTRAKFDKFHLWERSETTLTEGVTTAATLQTTFFPLSCHRFHFFRTSLSVVLNVSLPHVTR